MRTHPVSFAAVILALVSRIATAADSAEVFIRQGVELRRAGKDAEAHEKFQRAYEMSHSPRSAAQIGLCEQALGRWLDAEVHLTEALEAKSDPWINRNRETLRNSLDDVAGRLATVTVKGAPEGARVMINGSDAGHLPASDPHRVLAGEVVVQVTKEGYKPHREAVMVQGSQNAVVNVAMESAQVSSPPSLTSVDEGAGDATLFTRSDPSESDGRSFYKSPWLWGGIAAAAVAVVVVVLVVGGGTEYPVVDSTQSVPGGGM